MSRERIEAMDEEMLRLLKAGAPRIEAPAGAEARVFAKLAGSMPGLSSTSSAGGAGAAGVPATRGALTGWGAKITLASCASIGAIAAVAYIAAREPSRPPQVAPPVSAKTMAPAPAEGAAVPEPAKEQPPTVSFESLPPAPAPNSRRAPRAAPVESTPPSDIVAERAILDEARTALRTGDADRCLAALRRHAATAPRGELAEERDALEVRALAVAGRNDEARALATRFRAAHPGSLFQPAVDGALDAAPSP